MGEEFEEFTDDEITNILKEALKVKISERRKLPSKIQINKALIATISEFLSCFKLIGYDLDGNPINITAYKEKMEKSALDNAFLEEVSKFMENKMK